jgi:sulfonate transport system permease protein
MAVVDAPTLRGLDTVERPRAASRRRVWSTVWPKLAAVGLALGVWQLVVWTGWRPEFVLPSPLTVLARFFSDIASGELPRATVVTLRRAVVGYALAVVIGTLVGLAVSRSKVLRTAVGSLITGLQTMPSIAWFPLAILLFKLSEGAIMFVVVLGAAPSVANGLLYGVDHIPPLLLRAGRVMGARGFTLYRHVVLPAALPAFVAGLKQGWAFAWRSLMAGELLVIVANVQSLGVRLSFARELSDAPGLMAAMLAILLIGILVDGVVFGGVERGLRARRGLMR